MNTRLIPQALALGLAGIVTLATLGGVDFLAQQPHHEALLARSQTPAPVDAPAAAPAARALAVDDPVPHDAGRG
jgi:hypothetical protein